MEDLPDRVLQLLQHPMSQRELDRLPWGPKDVPRNSSNSKIMPAVDLSKVNVHLIGHLVEHILTSAIRGSVLVFLPGIGAINATRDALHCNRNLQEVPVAFTSLNTYRL